MVLTRFKFGVVASILSMTLAIPDLSFGQGVELLPNELRQVETSLGVMSCGLHAGTWIPGVLAKDGKTFTAFAWQIRKLKRTLSNTTDDVKRRKLTRKIASLTKKRRAGSEPCKTDEAVIPPGDSTPSPTPTPTPSTGAGCYDANRNTGCFGIPNGILGNEGRGEALFEGICSGCHTENQRRNRSYSELSSAFETVLAMRPFTSDLVSQDIADLVAYLNRYNPNQ